jgi:CRISPR system Cascade subunit CasA
MLQTMEGFMGRGNYGVARMNGGFASRPCVAYVDGADFGSRFRRDVVLMLAGRDALVDLYHYDDAGGRTLLWLESWSDGPGLPLSSLDPSFIEICRRVRLIEGSDGRLMARYGPSDAARVESKEFKGVIGDVWTPTRLDKTEATALTVSENGFDYRLLTDLLFPPDEKKYELPPAAQARAGQLRKPELLAQVLVRGQGKTAGYFERRLPIDVRTFGNDQRWREAGQVARARIQKAQEVQRKVLRPAILCLAQGGPEKIDFKADDAEPYLERFEQLVDQRFFAAIWRDIDLEDGNERDRIWEVELHDLARRIYATADGGVPVPEARRYKAIASADAAFHGSARKILPLAFEAAAEADP